MLLAEFDQALVSSTEFLRPFAVTLTRDQEAAGDLLQETLYRALANRDKYYSGTNLKAWLYTIMRNIFINSYRKSSRQSMADATRSDILINLQAGVVANDGPTQLTMRELQAAIYGLPEIFRRPFLLFFDGYRYQEISELLEEPLGTIKSRIFFARKLLKAQLDRY